MPGNLIFDKKHDSYRCENYVTSYDGVGIVLPVQWLG